MAMEEAKTSKNKSTLSKTWSAPISGGDKIKMAERYCANAITGMLYPRITENMLKIFLRSNLFLRLSILGFLVSGQSDF